LPDAVDAPAKLRLLHGEKRDRETEKKREVPNFIYKKAKQKAKKKKRKKYTRKHAMVGKRQQRKRQMRSADILQASGRTSVSERLQKTKNKKIKIQ
jgi:ribosomal protein L35